MSTSMQIAVVGGRAMRYLDDGERSATHVLVLVHAFPIGVRLFDPQRDAFPGWRVLVPALPGFDGSDLLDTPDIDAYARQVLGLLDELRVPKAVFGGVSLGGYLIFGVLRQAADRVAGLILADTRSAADTAEARAGRQRLLDIVRGGGPSAVADDMIPKVLGKTTLHDRPAIAADVRRMIEAQTPEGIAAAIQVLMSRPDSTPLLERIRVPTLAIVGSEDVLTPPPEMERMAAAIAGARFVPIEGAGHLSNAEAPEAFNQEVAGWLGSWVAW